MEKELLEYISSGIVLGLIAGISPGPLLTMVIGETIKHGKQEGIKMAIIPLITDLPIVILSLFILSRLAGYETVIGIIAILGGFFLLYLAYENLVYKPAEKLKVHSEKKNILKGIAANFLSPHPYIFWILIGGTILLKALKQSPVSAFIFLSVFYLCLVGSKIVVALLTHRFSAVLKTRGYIYTIRILGVLLFLFAVYFFYEGVNYIF
jgi:threonine/homoserine/homoserine lactone efflux protein